MIKILELNKKNIFESSFVIEPLNIGQGLTLGNTLRRNLLADIGGYGITGARINNFKNEYQSIPGIKEEIFEILLNLQKITVKNLLSPININKSKNTQQKAYLNVEGPCIVTSNLFFLPNNGFSFINNKYICTILDNSSLYIELDLAYGKGYDPIIQNNKIDRLEPYTFLFKTYFNPIKKVSIRTHLIQDSFGNLKESLYINIHTNGSISPKRCLFESFKTTLNLYSELFINLNLNSFLKKNTVSI